MARWFIDGNNVMGSRPDGWWNNRPKAMARLAQEVAEWSWTHEDQVLLIFDGRTIPAVAMKAGGNLTVEFAERSARNAADDLLVVRIDEALTGVERSDGAGETALILVTADRGLIERCPETVSRVGPRQFLEQVGSAT